MAPATFQVHSETAAITAELSWPVLAHRHETEKEASGAHYTRCGRPHRHPDRRQPLAQAMAAEEEAASSERAILAFAQGQEKERSTVYLSAVSGQPTTEASHLGQAVRGERGWGVIKTARGSAGLPGPRRLQMSVAGQAAWLSCPRRSCQLPAVMPWDGLTCRQAML